MPNNLSKKSLKKSFVLQQDQSDCGVACLLSIIRFYKGTNSLENLRNLSSTTIRGTTLLGLYQTANQLGFNAEGCEADINSLIDHNAPVILHIEPQPNFEHYIVCYGHEHSHFIIGDPAMGIQFISAEKLAQLWKSKVCLTLEPTTKFVTSKNRQNLKNHFFLKLLKEDKKLLLFSLILGTGIALLGMALSLFSQKLVDDILPKQKLNKLIGGIILLTAMLALKVCLTALREQTLNIQSKNFNIRVISAFYSSLLFLPKPFFDTRKIGELTARLNDTVRIQRTIRILAGNYIIELLTLLVTASFLLYYSWQSGLVILLSIPLYFYLVSRYNKKIISSQQQVMQDYALNEANYISSMNSITTIKNMGRENYFIKNNHNFFSQYQNSTFQLGKINIRLSILIGIAGVTFIIFILIFNTIQVWNKNLTLGEFMAIIAMSGSLIPSVTTLALINIPLSEAKVAFDRMYDFVSIDKEQDKGIKINSIQKIELNNLSFRFPGRNLLINNVNLSLQKQSLTILVGESGSGKTTLSQILQKFYACDERKYYSKQQI